MEVKKRMLQKLLLKLAGFYDKKKETFLQAKSKIYACDAELLKTSKGVKQLVGWIQEVEKGDKIRYTFEQVKGQWAIVLLKFPAPQIMFTNL